MSSRITIPKFKREQNVKPAGEGFDRADENDFVCRRTLSGLQFNKNKESTEPKLIVSSRNAATRTYTADIDDPWVPDILPEPVEASRVAFRTLSLQPREPFDDRNGHSVLLDVPSSPIKPIKKKQRFKLERNFKNIKKNKDIENSAPQPQQPWMQITPDVAAEYLAYAGATVLAYGTEWRIERCYCVNNNGAMSRPNTIETSNDGTIGKHKRAEIETIKMGIVYSLRDELEKSDAGFNMHLGSYENGDVTFRNEKYAISFTVLFRQKQDGSLSEIIYAFEGTKQGISSFAHKQRKQNITQSISGRFPAAEHCKIIGRILENVGLENELAVVFTGHSFGGALAFASMLNTVSQDTRGIGIAPMNFGKDALESLGGMEAFSEKNIIVFEMEGDPVKSINKSQRIMGRICYRVPVPEGTWPHESHSRFYGPLKAEAMKLYELPEHVQKYK